MNADNELTSALQRVLADRDLYRTRCGLAAARLRQIEEMAVAAGVGVWSLDKPAPQPQPMVTATLPFEELSKEGLGDWCRAEITTACIIDAFVVSYHASLDNRAPEAIRFDPTLNVDSRQPLVRSMAVVDEVIVPELRRLGWRQLSEEDLAAYCPGIWVNNSISVERALTVDIHGWLGDEPMLDVTPNEIVPYRAAVLALYEDGAPRLTEVARHTPWAAEIEALLRASGGNVERLSPNPYSSMSWTVDFGEIQNGEFYARFFTDVHVSTLAPVWYFGDRFTVKSTHPESLRSELSDWKWGDYGYLIPQTDMIAAVTAALSARGFSHIDDWYLKFYIAGIPALKQCGDAVMLGELLFRDVLGLFPAAPRVEEEHIWRHIRHRVGRLQP